MKLFMTTKKEREKKSFCICFEKITKTSLSLIVKLYVCKLLVATTVYLSRQSFELTRETSHLLSDVLLCHKLK